MNNNDSWLYWLKLMESRGIAGDGARGSGELDKLIVERGVINEFAHTVSELLSVEVSDIKHEDPPLPDFVANLLGQKIRIELVEFIDRRLLEQAKHIRKTLNHPLHERDLWFGTSQEWFVDLLLRNIENKDQVYRSREAKVDVLLVWNEAEQVGIDDTDRWLQAFELPALTSVSSIYFQSWYHPKYVARPTWSIKPHPLIGELKPIQIE